MLKCPDQSGMAVEQPTEGKDGVGVEESQRRPDSPAQVGLQQGNSGTLMVSRVILRATSLFITVSREDIRRESGFQEVLGRGRNPCRKPRWSALIYVVVVLKELSSL